MQDASHHGAPLVNQPSSPVSTTTYRQLQLTCIFFHTAPYATRLGTCAALPLATLCSARATMGIITPVDSTASSVLELTSGKVARARRIRRAAVRMMMTSRAQSVSTKQRSRRRSKGRSSGLPREAGKLHAAEVIRTKTEPLWSCSEALDHM